MISAVPKMDDGVVLRCSNTTHAREGNGMMTLIALTTATSNLMTIASLKRRYPPSLVSLQPRYEMGMPVLISGSMSTNSHDSFFLSPLCAPFR